FSLAQQRADVRLEAIALANHPDPHAIAMQRGEVIADEAAQQAEQIADLARRPRPVLGRERKYGEIANTELVRGAHDPAQRLDAAAMTLRPRQSARRSPAAIAIHDDGNM